MGQRFPLAREAILELCRFLGLVLLAFRNLRADLEGVSASDALTFNGGLVASRGLGSSGLPISLNTISGEGPEQHDFLPGPFHRVKL